MFMQNSTDLLCITLKIRKKYDKINIDISIITFIESGLCSLIDIAFIYVYVIWYRLFLYYSTNCEIKVVIKLR